MRARLSLLMLVASGCDHLLDIHHISTGTDAVADTVADTAIPDAFEGSAGCADGTREGFVDRVAFPMIAGCSGAWTVGGVKPAVPPTCMRMAGNSGANPDGAGCNVSDLCAPGWDVCQGKTAVGNRLGGHTCDEVTATPSLFFATRQSGPGGDACSMLASDVDDVFGCGTIGLPAQPSSCAPLTVDTGNDCSAIKTVGGWSCSNPSEAQNITKTDAINGGGVLCCVL